MICPGGECATAADTARANSLLDASRTRGNISTALFVVGGAAVATGAFLFFTAHDDTAPRAAFAPVVTDTQVGLAVGGAF